MTPLYGPAGTLWSKVPELLLETSTTTRGSTPGPSGASRRSSSNGGERAPVPGLRFDDQGQRCAIFDVLGVPDDKTWPGFSSTPFATNLLPELDVHQNNYLRELFPEATLSKEGFEVLNGLLTCNPDKRLTAKAALEHMWFAKVDELNLPRKDELASALPGKKMLMVRAACAKKRKLQCV